MRLWLGGYTAEDGGSADGIGVLHAGAADSPTAAGPLAYAGTAASAPSPSWLARHPSLDVVYAALEGAGAVQAYGRVGGERLRPLGSPVAAGEAACHVAVAPDGSSLVASCWGDGRVVRIPLDDAGRAGAPQIAAAADDPHTPGGAAVAGGAAAGDFLPSSPGVALPDLAAAARALRAAAGEEYGHLVPEYDAPAVGAEPEASAERASHAHQATFLHGGLVVTTDMGFDMVRFWRDGAEGLREVQRVVLPGGTGPRHVVWHPSGHLYVLTELSREVFVLASGPPPDSAGAPTWRIVGAAAAGAGTLDDDTAAELCASRDGEFVYAGVRGSNTIATLRVRGGGETLSPVALVEAGVDWPRHHLVRDDTLLIAGERSDEVVSRTLDPRTGVPGSVRHRTAAPTPTCLLPVE